MLTESGGLTASMAHLNMEELIRIAGVPRSSVYRTWGSKEAFHVDLMERMIMSPQTQNFFDEVVRIDRQLIEEHTERLGTAAGRRAVLQEVVRRGVSHSFTGTARSLLWRSVTALTATLPALEEADRARIQAALATSQAAIVGQIADFYQEILPVLGMRMKDGFEVGLFVATASSVVDGLMRRAVTNPDVVEYSITKPGLDGAPIEWKLPEIAFLAIVDAMIEADPAFEAASR